MHINNCFYDGAPKQEVTFIMLQLLRPKSLHQPRSILVQPAVDKQISLIEKSTRFVQSCEFGAKKETTYMVYYYSNHATRNLRTNCLVCGMWLLYS